MTKKQRDQVVELLRCAADSWYATGQGIGYADHFIGADSFAWRKGVDAWYAAYDSLVDTLGWGYGDICLLAAARVEEGSWP